MTADCWFFGYGSLIWRPEFAFSARHPGYIDGWARRFWQGSPDHRGTPDRLGRVVTLVQEPGARCWGMAYRVHAAEVPAVLATLDHRESGGYERLPVTIHMAAAPTGVAGQTYVATSENPHYLGPAALADMVAQILVGHGQSGPNRDYVLRLAESLRAMDATDPHVFELADQIRAAIDKKTGAT